jgi:hypothetical protein
LAGLAAGRDCLDEAMIGATWGVSHEETLLHYACDESVSSPTLQAWRGVTVRATPDRVWPWLIQVRIAPYSYDWIDNGGRRSPCRLLDLPEPRVGDPFTTAAGRELGRILAVDHGRQLTATIMGAFMSYLLVPAELGATRLLLKVVASTARWMAPALSVGDLIMARRQLLNLRELAERDPDEAAR